MDLVEISPNIQGHLKRLRRSASVLADFRAARGRSPGDFARILDEIERQDRTANRRFTVAFVGMYNCGKSTILNSLLGLQGEARLSDNDSPDTARSIRIGYRADPGDPECVLHFGDGTHQECAWAEARAFTSEVYLEEHPEARARAEQLLEVEYYLADPLLLSLDFLDLPGTGTGNWRTHTALTHQRLKEAELIFWVIGTCAPEPTGSDLEDLRILKEVKANVVPLINVWSVEEEGITGDVEAEEMVTAIRTHLAPFFAADAPCFKYYAREIDLARQRDRKLREEWGMEPLVLFLGSLLGTDTVRRQRIRRIGGVVGAQLRRLEDLVGAETQLLQQIERELATANGELLLQEEDRLDIGRSLRPRVRELAEDCARQVVSLCTDAANAFIDDELRLTNWKLLAETLKREPVEVIQERMRARFERDYLRLAESPHWIDRLHHEFLDDVEHVVHGVWARFLRDLESSPRPTGFEAGLGTRFLDRALEQIGGSMLQRGFLLALTGVFTYLLLIPGGFLIDVASVLSLVVLQTFQDPLEKPRNTAKLRARVALEANRIEIRNVFVEEGMALHQSLDATFREELQRRGLRISTEQEALRQALGALEAIRSELASFQEDMVRFEAGTFA